MLAIEWAKVKEGRCWQDWHSQGHSAQSKEALSAGTMTEADLKVEAANLLEFLDGMDS